ncbi:SAM-dependent methyltransferase [Candidatus Methylacidiphilum fumarolicum]|uniref:methyltransferase domain-containing protein n=1 Tax=Candidatus Methylacidiphilum fumarolicum TaxID=591154 RepID=UPI0003180BE3|nr:methyltransferase domain-containing protein [Candidatus Methylacidiphilum fumarolicum]MBW6414894.1 methyltransferase domain-containing protein [Candidatus Methylacidiphilum fumarolicum]TFE73558.1 SAM-dependent methyltransferase [Candidatus Methylacidiphilum fumarolicum]TFE74981.1 SAM-dependent methyltransferase [Candidatus Methylacidiphilum fumarolicum]
MLIDKTLIIQFIRPVDPNSTTPPLDDYSYWESKYQSGQAGWDRGAPSPALVEVLQRFPTPKRVLVPGCGTGHDVHYLASLKIEAVGIDFAPSAIETARKKAQSPLENYLLADIFSLPQQFHESFDLIWEHTCFCAIPPIKRPHYVQSMYSMLRPDGLFLGIFFLDTESSTEPPPYCFTLNEIDRHFDPYFQLEAEWLPSAYYPGREGEEIVRLYKKLS